METIFKMKRMSKITLIDINVRAIIKIEAVPSRQLLQNNPRNVVHRGVQSEVMARPNDVKQIVAVMIKKRRSLIFHITIEI